MVRCLHLYRERRSLVKRLTIVAIAAALAQFASAETWYWSPKTKTDKYYYWNANNWTNSTGTVGKPALGDTAVLGRGTATDYA